MKIYQNADWTWTAEKIIYKTFFRKIHLIVIWNNYKQTKEKIEEKLFNI